MSLKGIARAHMGKTGDINVIQDILEKSTLSDTHSVRDTLSEKATETHKYHMDECIYGWKVKYTQIWSHISVEIKLVPKNGATDAQLSALKPVWKQGIEGAWNEKWACSRSGELKCKFSFEVFWVTSGHDHRVRVHGGDGRANMGNWYAEGFDGDEAAHEFGHMIGHEDEYVEDICPDRSPVGTDTIMGPNENPDNIPSRMMKGFANNIGSNVVAI